MSYIKNPFTGGYVADLTKMTFGRLTPIRIAPNGSVGYPKWECVCTCGNTVVVRADNLRSGSTKSCGCLHSEVIASVMSGNDYAKTPMSKDKYKAPDEETYTRGADRLYSVYKSMKSRCYNVKAPNYKNYGARGIRICEEWLEDFDSFRSWALKSGYDYSAKRGECTIDRIDPDGNYSPENCRWVSMLVQRHNRRKTPEIKSH